MDVSEHASFSLFSHCKSVLFLWVCIFYLYLVKQGRGFSWQQSGSDCVSGSEQHVFWGTLIMLELWRPEWDTPTYWKTDERELHMLPADDALTSDPWHLCLFLGQWWPSGWPFHIFYSPMLFGNLFGMRLRFVFNLLFISFFSRLQTIFARFDDALNSGNMALSPSHGQYLFSFLLPLLYWRAAKSCDYFWR